ncbi:acetyltransferase [Ramlibacter algicola]|uniref:acetyltransferase n=1 Tax=Ramlibacter algicola TaxID=2795217 RepID=UPI003084574E
MQSAHTTLLILGAGGHGRVVADAALAQGTWERVCASDRDPDRCHGELLPGVPLQAPDAPGPAAVHIAIGAATGREREARAASLPLATVVHPHASVSPLARVGAGSFVAAQAVLAPLAQLGSCVIVNHGAVIDHDCVVGDFSHVAPLAALGGQARVGARVLVGAGAHLLPGVRVCDDVVIGAGAVVRSDIDVPGVYAGVPARRVR